MNCRSRGRPVVRVKEQILRLKAAGDSHIGLKRKVNEDSYLLNPETGLFVIADGMGGHRAGDVASRIVVDTINDYWVKVGNNRPPAFIEKTGKDLPDMARHLVNSISLANLIIYEAQQKPQYQGMGSTVSALLVDKDFIWSANVGDSRVYLSAGGTLRIISEEHSVEAEQRDMGLFNPHNSSNPFIKNLLTRALGLNKKVDAFITSFEPAPGDMILMCSDGLTNFTSEESIRMTLNDASLSIEKKVKKLINTANKEGGGDNITVILLEILPKGPWSRLKNRLKIR